MRARTRGLARGFTLIELLIVVAIVSMLALLVSYGVRKHQASVKTAEATESLIRMGKNQQTEFDKQSLAPGAAAGPSRQLCGNAGATVPANAGLIKGQTYQSTAADWTAPTDCAANVGFCCLKFSISKPQYYMYNWQVNGTGVGGKFTATAQGDLNGDGVLSSFQLFGQVGANGILSIDPNMVSEKPEE